MGQNARYVIMEVCSVFFYHVATLGPVGHVVTTSYCKLVRFAGNWCTLHSGYISRLVTLLLRTFCSDISCRKLESELNSLLFRGLDQYSLV